MTIETNNSPSFVTTVAGTRIPKIGTLAYHPSVGFCDVVGRIGERVRIRVTDFSGASEVVLTPNNGETIEIISRQEYMKRLADISETIALAEINDLEVRAATETDGLYGASALVKQLSESAISRTRGANEMIVNIDAAEASGWEFDEYLVERPKSERKRGKAPAPRLPKKAPSKVGTLEDPTKPDWLVAEMNECFGDTWMPSERA